MRAKHRAMHKDWKRLNTTEQLAKALAANCLADDALFSDINDVIARTEELTCESLRQQLAEKDAEIENVRRANLDCVDHFNAAMQDLAASQAREQKVTSDFCAAISHAISLSLEGAEFLRCWNEGDWSGCREFGFEPSEQLTSPKVSDTTALSAMIAKAGEVMRERCAAKCPSTKTCYTSARDEIESEIRALPGVTLEDIK